MDITCKQVVERDPDQTPHSVASDLGLHCLRCPIKRTLGLYGLTLANCMCCGGICV